MNFPPSTPPQRRTLDEPPPLINPFNQYEERGLWRGFSLSEFYSPTPAFGLLSTPDTPCSSTFDASNYSPTAHLDFERFTLADYNNQDTSCFRLNNGDGEGFFGDSIRYADIFMPYQNDLISVKPVINCEVDKGFIWANNSHKTVATTYRRNFFQISTSVILQPNDQIQIGEEELGSPLVMMNGEYIPVDSFSVGISASMCDDYAVVEDSVNLVQFSTAREKGPKCSPSRLQVQALISNDSDDKEAEVVRFERIQFERSTYRKLEKFCLSITLHAQLKNGAEAQIGAVRSMPIVVRGRSPGHYPDDSYAGRTLPRAKSTQVLRKKSGKKMRVSKSTPSFHSNTAVRRMSSITLDSAASGASQQDASAQSQPYDAHDTTSTPDTHAKPTLQDLAMACEIDMATL